MFRSKPEAAGGSEEKQRKCLQILRTGVTLWNGLKKEKGDIGEKSYRSPVF